MGLKDQTIHIVGAGLAGSECAYQLALKGYRVQLYEMRDQTLTAAHKTSGFAELVCSNSFGSQTNYSAPGQLKWEAEALGSLILRAAQCASVPAGMALSVDRKVFSDYVTSELKKLPNLTVVNKVVESLEELPRPAVIATGPLTHEPLALSLKRHFGEEFLYFFDAIAPIIDADSINMDIAWKGDRFGQGTKDYINCGLNKEQYFHLIEEIKAARKIEPKEFEVTPYFEGCMPIEAMIERGDQTPRFGPMSPKGLTHPSGEKYYAVVQLRQDNKEATAYNMVGFQTKMAYGEQTRIFRMIPGLEEAEFLKLGSMHRNLFIHSPKMLTPSLSSPKDPDLYFAGQITGVEGYFESTCIGLLVSRFLDDRLSGRPLHLPPRESAFGSLLNGITEEKENFQPTNINFGLFPRPAEEKASDSGIRQKKKERKKEKRDLQILLAQKSILRWVPGPISVNDRSNKPRLI